MIWLLFQTKSFLKGKANRQIFERGDYYFLCCSQSYRLYLTTASISKPESGGGGLQSFPFLFIYRQNHFKNNNLLLTVDKSHLMSTVHILKKPDVSRAIPVLSLWQRLSALFIYCFCHFDFALVRQHFLILHRGKCVLSFQLITTKCWSFTPRYQRITFFLNLKS